MQFPPPLLFTNFDLHLHFIFFYPEISPLSYHLSICIIYTRGFVPNEIWLSLLFHMLLNENFNIPWIHCIQICTASSNKITSLSLEFLDSLVLDSNVKSAIEVALLIMNATYAWVWIGQWWLTHSTCTLLTDLYQSGRGGGAGWPRHRMITSRTTPDCNMQW